MSDVELVADEAQLEELLSRPTQATIDAMIELGGDLLVLGAGGKMGPSLLRLARRSADASGIAMKVIGVSRFSNDEVRAGLERDGIETIRCDFLDPFERPKLPDAANVLIMSGHKFSGGRRVPGAYWAMNTYVPGLLAEGYRNSRLVCFSSGNVYPFTPLHQPAPQEEVEPAPVGEYATTVWGREQMLEFVSDRYGTQVCLLRLNYAVDLRYGVLVDLAARIVAGQPVDLSVPEFNCVWQGYANAVALRSFVLADSPPRVVNLTGSERCRVREVACALGRRLGVEPTFIEPEGALSLISDASRCHAYFGPPEIDLEPLLDLVAAWLKAGGRQLGLPTKFNVRDGKY